MSRGTVAVVGAGLIGANWAVLFASSGYDVWLFDQNPDFLEQARVRAEAAKSSGVTVRAANDLASAVSDAQLIQENIAEIQDAKAALLAKIEASCPLHSLICSSTSTIEPDVLFGELKSPERALIAHPFNPPHILRLVELVPGPATSAPIMAEAHRFYSTIGMAPIALKRSVPGFVGNRLQAAVLTEALRLVAAGVVSPEDLDAAMKTAVGPRWAIMGPFETFDLGAKDGFRSFCKNIGLAFQALGPTFDMASPWPDEAIDQVENWRRSVLPSSHIAQRQEDRDLALQAVLAAAGQFAASA